MAEKPQKFMDVAKPGTLRSTSGSGRPLIVTNRPVVQDPMVAPAAAHEVESDDDQKEPVLPPKKVVIKPLDDDSETPVTPQAPDGPEVSDEEVKQTAKGETLDLTPAVDEEGETADSEPIDVSTRPLSVKLDEVGPTKSPEASDAVRPRDREAGSESDPKPTSTALAAQQQEAETKAQDELDRLIESKDYNLPINAAAERRSRLVAIFGIILILVLAAVWVDVALDSGILEINGLHPLTHLFQSK